MVNIFKQITFVIIVLLLTILTPGCFTPKDNNDIENSFTSDEGVSETIENNPRRKVPQKQR